MMVGLGSRVVRAETDRVVVFGVGSMQQSPSIPRNAAVVLALAGTDAWFWLLKVSICFQLCSTHHQGVTQDPRIPEACTQSLNPRALSPKPRTVIFTICMCIIIYYIFYSVLYIYIYIKCYGIQYVSIYIYIYIYIYICTYTHIHTCNLLSKSSGWSPVHLDLQPPCADSGVEGFGR